MSEGSLEGKAAQISIADLERRARLASGAAPSLEDQQDWARSLLGTPDDAGARLLLDSIHIQQGFSRQLEASRGLATAARAPLTGNTVELAIAELRALAETVAPLIAGSLAKRPLRRESAPGLHPSAALRKGAVPASERPLGDLVGGLCRWLRGPAEADLFETPDGLIDAIRGTEGEATSFDARGLAGAPFPMVAASLALQGLRRFLRSSGDLLVEPLGSPRLFHATAALDSVGLGPYFANIGQIIRRSANLFELAAIAEEVAARSGLTMGEEAWVALLSRHLAGGLLAEVVDDLGDRNAAFALRTILDRALSWPAAEIDQALVMRIRDAALDNLDYDLAAHAQQALVKLRPGQTLEWQILATIDASGGRTVAAEQLFIACLDHDPANELLKQQIEANRMRQFAPFALVKGFGSPHDRQLERLRRRSEPSRH